MLFRSISGGGAVTGGVLGAVGTLNKTACSYGPGRLAASLNAGAASPTTLGAGPFPWTTTLVIGDSPWGPGNQIGGHMRRVRYWPRALSNAELQQVTT